MPIADDHKEEIDALNEEESRQCVACGGREFCSRRIVDSRYIVVECQACRLAWTSPPSAVESSHYDNLPQFAQVYADRERLTRQYAIALLDVLKPFMSSGKFLDIGCSVGSLVAAAEERGYAADGIDLDGNAVEVGRRLGRSVHRCGLTEWMAGAYDVLCLQHTLEHVSDPVEFLTACSQKLRVGGVVIVSVPCHDGLHPRIFGKRWYGWQPKQHYFHYSAESLRRVLQRASFQPAFIFQNSMDHRPAIDFRSPLLSVKHTIMAAVAYVGATIGRGDQLIAVARKCDD